MGALLQLFAHEEFLGPEQGRFLRVVSWNAGALGRERGRRRW